MSKKKYPYSVCKKLSKYGERFNLRYHIKEECYHLTDSRGTPMLLAVYSKYDRDLGVHAWETLEELYNEPCNLQVQLNLIREERNKYYHKALETTKKAKRDYTSMRLYND